MDKLTITCELAPRDKLVVARWLHDQGGVAFAIETVSTYGASLVIANAADVDRLIDWLTAWREQHGTGAGGV